MGWVVVALLQVASPTNTLFWPTAPGAIDALRRLFRQCRGVGLFPECTCRELAGDSSAIVRSI